MSDDAMTTNNKVVLFVDILGFAALSESYPIDLDALRIHDRLFSPSLNVDMLVDLLDRSSHNQLIHAFSGFHSSLRASLNLANMRHPLTAITFSDSAFIATTHVYEAVNIAIDLIHSMLSQKIPVRMGIAYGSFTTLRFRSDITVDGGDHTAQFLGTAIVRAHAAETCGIKGLRILLHPSVMPLWNDGHHNPASANGRSYPIRHLECSEKERLENKTGVIHEINYWYYLTHKRETDAWRGLQDMWDKAPLSEVEHYEVTVKAINRMRVAQGHEPLKKLRRRTLPV